MSLVKSVYSEKEPISRKQLYYLALGDETAIKDILSIFISTLTENIAMLECYISSSSLIWDNTLREIIACAEAMGAKEFVKTARESSKHPHQTNAQRRTCLTNLKNVLRDIKLFDSKIGSHF